MKTDFSVLFRVRELCYLGVRNMNLALTLLYVILCYDVHHSASVPGECEMSFSRRSQVEDVNDNAPQLNAVSYVGTVKEDARPGTPVILSPAVQVSLSHPPPYFYFPYYCNVFS